MPTNKEIKALSRNQLKGKWGILALVNLGVVAVMFLLGYYVNGIVAQILCVPLMVGSSKLMLSVANGEELDLNNFIANKTVYIRYLVFTLILALIQMLVGIIFALVSGGVLATSFMMGGSSIDENIMNLLSQNISSIIILTIVALILMLVMIYIELIYSMTEYIILRDNEDIDAIMSMKYSRMLIKGHLWEFFKLQISFIGWYLLSILTAGIGIIFVNSYVMTSSANFYLELVYKEEEKAREMGIINSESNMHYRSYMNNKEIF
ncbi:DUF975 family protein [Peptostreptococcus russellii]|uniref:DUF975 family protein n=1 Tax=Peptostreptococcus russellii TaxID=215200 RepID=UPI003F588A7F